MEAINFVRTQWQPLPYPTHSFTGQTIIVTGSNTGLGLEAARHFARLGASKLILACRSVAKGEAAAADIKASLPSDSATVIEVWQLDMGNFSNVQQFAKRCEQLERLDVVVENAGVARYEWSVMEGFETTIAINVVGTFLLALNLLPILRRSFRSTGAVTRLVITSSEVHGWSKMAERYYDSIFDALKKNDRDLMKDRYNTSKLLEVFMVRALATAMDSSASDTQPIILNTVTPGLCHSSLSRDMVGIQSLFFWCLKALLARTTEMGSRALLYGATGDEKSHGQYMSGCEVVEPSAFVRSEEGRKTQERVYEELMDILEKLQPGIRKNI